MTKAQFVKQADRICLEALERKDAALKTAMGAASAADAGFDNKANQEKLVLTVALPQLRSIVEELNELEPPEGGEGRIRAMIAALDEGLAEAEEDPGSTLVPPVSVLDKSNTLAEGYGLHACAELG